MGHIKFFFYFSLVMIIAVFIFTKGRQAVLILGLIVLGIIFLKWYINKPKKEKEPEIEYNPNDDFISLYQLLGMKEDSINQYPFYLGDYEDDNIVKYGFKANGNKIDVFLRNKELIEEFLNNYFCENTKIHEIMRNEKNNTIIDIIIKKQVEPSRIDIKDVVGEEDHVDEDKKEFPDDRIKINNEIDWEFRKAPHALINGGTGGGKTFFIFYLIIIILKMKALLKVLDPKHSDLSYSSDFLGENVVYKHEDIAKVMLDTVKEMHKRADEMDKRKDKALGKDYKDYGYKPVFVIFDEMMAFMRGGVDPKTKQQVNKAVLDLIAMGRQLGFFLIIAMQRGSTKAIDGDVRDQIHFRCTLGKMGLDGYKMAFGDNYNLEKTIKGKGSGFIQIAGIDNREDLEEPQQFYTPYIDKGYDLLNEIKELTKESHSDVHKKTEERNKKTAEENAKKVVQGNFPQQELKAVNENEVVIENLEDLDLEDLKDLKDLKDITDSSAPKFKPKD